VDLMRVLTRVERELGKQIPEAVNAAIGKAFNSHNDHDALKDSLARAKEETIQALREENGRLYERLDKVEAEIKETAVFARQAKTEIDKMASALKQVIEEAQAAIGISTRGTSEERGPESTTERQPEKRPLAQESPVKPAEYENESLADYESEPEKGTTTGQMDGRTLRQGVEDLTGHQSEPEEPPTGTISERTTNFPPDPRGATPAIEAVLDGATDKLDVQIRQIRKGAPAPGRGGRMPSVQETEEKESQSSSGVSSLVQDSSDSDSDGSYRDKPDTMKTKRDASNKKTHPEDLRFKGDHYRAGAKPSSAGGYHRLPQLWVQESKTGAKGKGKAKASVLGVRIEEYGIPAATTPQALQMVEESKALVRMETPSPVREANAFIAAEIKEGRGTAKALNTGRINTRTHKGGDSTPTPGPSRYQPRQHNTPTPAKMLQRVRSILRMIKCPPVGCDGTNEGQFMTRLWDEYFPGADTKVVRVRKRKEQPEERTVEIDHADTILPETIAKQLQMIGRGILGITECEVVVERQTPGGTALEPPTPAPAPRTNTRNAGEPQEEETLKDMREWEVSTVRAFGCPPAGGDMGEKEKWLKKIWEAQFPRTEAKIEQMTIDKTHPCERIFKIAHSKKLTPGAIAHQLQVFLRRVGKSSQCQTWVVKGEIHEVAFEIWGDHGQEAEQRARQVMRHNNLEMVPRETEWMGQIRQGKNKRGNGMGYLRVSFCGQFKNQLKDTPYKKNGKLIQRWLTVYLWDQSLVGFRDREGKRVTLACRERRPLYRSTNGNQPRRPCTSSGHLWEVQQQQTQSGKLRRVGNKNSPGMQSVQAVWTLLVAAPVPEEGSSKTSAPGGIGSRGHSTTEDTPAHRDTRKQGR